MSKLVRRGLLKAGLSSLVLTGALGMQSTAFAAEKVIRIALQPAPLLGYYVRDMKLLEKRGFKPEWIVMPFSPPILEGMAAGSIDMALLGVAPMISAAMRNPDLWYIYDELANAAGLVVRADSNIRSAADLKGKKIAFPGKASQLYAMLAMYLSGSGIKDSDIDLVRANATDMNTLFQRKEVDGILVWPPFTSELVRTGAARSLFTANDMLKLKGGQWLNSGWGVRAQYARQNEDAVLAVIESLHEATQALRQRPDEVYAVFAKATGYTPEAVKFLVGQGFNAYYDPKDTAPSAAALTTLFQTLEKYEIMKSDRPIGAAMQSIAHPEFVEQVLKNAPK